MFDVPLLSRLCAFPPSAIIKRKPLSPTARRAGWIGCNIALNRIPFEARIPLVKDCEVISETEVREQFRRLKPLKDISVAQRGWALDVLNIVRRISIRSSGRESAHSNPSGLSLLTSSPTREFTNEEVYAFARELEQLHPGNRHIKDKIRQQLQVLRDTGFLIHVGSPESIRGWRLP